MMNVFFFRVPLIINQALRINFGLAFKMTFLLWCVCGGLLLHMFESNYFTMLVKPVYEKPIDTAQDVLDRGLTVIYLRESESIQEIEKNSASYITRQLAERGIVPKVKFCSGYGNIIVITFFQKIEWVMIFYGKGKKSLIKTNIF